MTLKRRAFSKEFKLHVVREVRLGKRQAEIARQYQILPKLTSRWVVEYETYAAEAFAGQRHPYTRQAQAVVLARSSALAVPSPERSASTHAALRGTAACLRVARLLDPAAMRREAG